MREILESLLKPDAQIDLAEINGLTPHVKRQIRVPARCSIHCPYKNTCRYHVFLQESMCNKIDFQVTNHNYLLADTLHRAGGKKPLIPNYQTIIIDEAHKLLSAARSMYGTTLSGDTVNSMLGYLCKAKFASKLSRDSVRITVEKLYKENKRLFRNFAKFIAKDEHDDDAERFSVELDSSATRHINNIKSICDRLHDQIDSEPLIERHAHRKAQMLWEINQIRKTAATLSSSKDLICWLELDDNGCISLCSIPKDLNSRLYDDLWKKGIPTILTSGTLSAGGDFSHIKRILGLDLLWKDRVTETSKPSPFNHRENALIYISERMPFPDGKNQKYIEEVANEVERLIRASHGHAAVLFTSYDAMGRVYSILGYV